MSQFQTLTVYLGSSGHSRDIYRDAAQTLGRLIGENKKRLVYGGMDAGLMGLVASGTLQAGGHVTGIIPKTLKDSERIHPDLSETILVKSLWERKRKMFMKADVIVGLPGGFGTLDECLEVLYWGHLGLHDKPLALINIEGYWDDLISYIHTLDDFDERFLIVVNTIEELFPALESWKFPQAIEETEKDLPHFEGDILDGSKEPLIFKSASVAATYHLITALGLKQLGKHDRPIGILNKGEFDGLVKWFHTAEKEKFITSKCLRLFSVENDKTVLQKSLAAQKHIDIDLHNEKWGPSETPSHIEVREER